MLALPKIVPFYIPACFVLYIISGLTMWSQQPEKSKAPDAETIPPEINTALMQTTFEIVGPAVTTGKGSLGTIFLVAKVNSFDPDSGNWVFVTAAHVLRDIAGDYATVMMRRRATDGTFLKSPCKIRIRSQGQDKFTVHPTADVAAFNFLVPDALVPEHAINSNWFATDEYLNAVDIHPGDELLSLGYPLAVEANEAGFPILRSGKISSYPIVPMEKNRLLFDFNIFGGNSGGPVYFSFIDRFIFRKIDGPIVLGARRVDQKLVGLVSEQLFSSPAVTGTLERLGLSVIVPAPFITETLRLLPAPDQHLACEN